MSPLTLAQLKGLQELVQDVVSASVDAVEETHRAIARQPFAVLEWIPGVATPARLVEQAQDAVATGVYQSIRAVNHLAGAATAQALDWLEQQDAAAPVAACLVGRPAACRR